MKEVRIVKETRVDGRIEYVIQQKHWLFRWEWVDASINSIDFVNCIDYFNTLEDAKKHLCYFNGSKGKSEIVYYKKEK